jgi:hypothetical protein
MGILLVSYNESNIITVDEEGKIGVRKKQCTFQKRKQNVGDLDCLVLKIDKLLSQEFVQNVNSALCYARN